MKIGEFLDSDCCDVTLRQMFECAAKSDRLFRFELAKPYHGTFGRPRMQVFDFHLSWVNRRASNGLCAQLHGPSPELSELTGATAKHDAARRPDHTAGRDSCCTELDRRHSHG